MGNNKEEVYILSFDGVTDYSTIKNKKLKEMFEEAIHIEKKLKKVLISNLQEQEKEKDKNIIPKVFKKVVKRLKNEIKSFSGEEDEDEKLLKIITKQDWKVIKNIFWENNKIENNVFYNFIENMNFEFVETLKEELKKRKIWDIQEDVKKKVKSKI